MTVCWLSISTLGRLDTSLTMPWSIWVPISSSLPSLSFSWLHYFSLICVVSVRTSSANTIESALESSIGTFGWGCWYKVALKLGLAPVYISLCEATYMISAKVATTASFYWTMSYPFSSPSSSLQCPYSSSFTALRTSGGWPKKASPISGVQLTMVLEQIQG